MFNFAQNNKPGGLFSAQTPPAAPGPAAPSTSLFGAAPSTASNNAASGGLFGNAASITPNNAASGGLFGNTASNQNNAASGNLFGNTTNSSSNNNAPSGGLFGNTPSNQNNAPSGNLFGNTTNASSNNAPSGGLFENSSTNQSNTPSGSLFGAAPPTAPTTSQPAPSGSLFNLNSTQPKPNPAPATNSLFGASTTQPAAQTTSQNPRSDATQSQQDTKTIKSQPAYFDQLLERGKKRQHTDTAASTFGEIPSLQLGLGDIARKVRTLGHATTTSSSRTAAPDKRDESRAHYLLAASGVNTAAALRDLTTFNNSDPPSRPTLPLTADVDTDYDGYIQDLYRQSSLDLVEQGLQQAKKDFDAFLEEHVQVEWDAQRARIYQHFGLAKPSDPSSDDISTTTNGNRGAFGRSSRRNKLGASSAFAPASMAKSVLGSAANNGSLSRSTLFGDVAEKEANLANMIPAPEDRLSREKQDRYADTIKSLNIARLGESPFPLLHRLADVEAQPSADDTSHLVNAYKALAEIVREDATVTSSSETGAVKERQYASDYMDDSANSRKAFALRKRIIDGSRTFLEKQFFGQLQAAIAKSPREANLGGVPSVINKVRAYIRLRTLRKELGADSVELQSLNQDYCWVLIFHLLRAGMVQDAAQYVAENERAIKSMDRNFPVYLVAYARSEDRRLTPDLQSRINMEYSQRTRIAPENSLDPYRMACYKVLGRCELSRRNFEGVANQTMEDWTWLQFALAREVNRVEETASDVFGLDDIRAVIHEIGQRHFAQGAAEGAAGHGTFFFLQILAGQFESAVAWLYPHNYLTAVHFAIALDYYGLFRVNDFNGSEDLLSYTTRRQPQISFGHMLGYYTRDFRSSNPAVAVDYLLLICLDGDLAGEPGKRQTRLCHDALRELVLETREFAELLGDIRNDGQRIKGAIEQRLKLIRIDNETDLLRQITVVAAQTADESSRVTDAVLLYHLAEEYDEVISVCCRAVSDATCSEYREVTHKLEPLRPRSSKAAQAHDSSSLSLTSVDDAASLARNMLSLYKSNTMMYSKIKPSNRGLIELLLGMSTVKQQIEASKWAQALDTISSLNLLPLDAAGNINTIRTKAQTFNALPTLVSRNVGNLLIWTIVAAGSQRDVLRDSEYEPERKRLEEYCTDVARDTMVFAGLIRYKLSPRVWEVLARVGGDLGAF